MEGAGQRVYSAVKGAGQCCGGGGACIVLWRGRGVYSAELVHV